MKLSWGNGAMGGAARSIFGGRLKRCEEPCCFASRCWRDVVWPARLPACATAQTVPKWWQCPPASPSSAHRPTIASAGPTSCRSAGSRSENLSPWAATKSRATNMKHSCARPAGAWKATAWPIAGSVAFGFTTPRPRFEIRALRRPVPSPSPAWTGMKPRRMSIGSTRRLEAATGCWRKSSGSTWLAAARRTPCIHGAMTRPRAVPSQTDSIKRRWRRTNQWIRRHTRSTTPWLAWTAGSTRRRSVHSSPTPSASSTWSEMFPSG